MANMYINAMTDLWNSAGTTYSAIKINVTNAASAAELKLLHLQVGAVDKYAVDKTGNVVAAGTITSAGVVSSGGTLPSANDLAALGASGTAWSDLFLASGGVINWHAGDVTITHAADQLIFAGAALGYSFSHLIQPTANDGAALGASAVSWSDLYLATGAVINYGAGNAVLTHSDAVLTMAPGDLRITTAGTNAASVVTVGGIQTLTGKTMTTPTLTGSTITSATFTSILNAASATWSNLGAVTTCDINGGTIDGATIGATTPAVITGTTVTGTTGNLTTINTSQIIGTTASFVGGIQGGTLTTGQNVQSTGTSIMVGPAAGNNTIYLRPRGVSSSVGQVVIDNVGTISTPGNVYATGSVSAAGHFYTANAFVSTHGSFLAYANNGANTAFTSDLITMNVYGYGGLRINGFTGTNPYAQNLITGNPAWDIVGVYARHYPGVWAGLRLGVGLPGDIWDFRNNGQAYKAGGGSWADTSDARIKNVLGDYENGLDAVKALKPVRFTFKGNDTDSEPSNRTPEQETEGIEDQSTLVVPYRNSPHYGVAVKATEYIGLIAQEARPAVPETVMICSGFIDGKAVDDLHDLDPAPLVFVLINAVKELASRVEALEKS